MTKTFALAALALVIGVLPAFANSDHEFLAREIEKLVPAIQKLENAYERDRILEPMTYALARLGKFEAALRIADTMEPDAWQPNPRDEVWRITARRLAWQEDIAAATRSASRIDGKYSQADATLAVARTYMRNGDSEAAQRLLNRVKPTVESTLNPRAISYLGYMFARIGDSETARKLFATAKIVKDPSGVDIPGWPDPRWENIAFWQAKLGWTREALETAEKKDSRLAPVLSVLFHRRDWPQLIRLASEMPSLKAAGFLTQVAFHQAESGDSPSARKTIDLAKVKLAEAEVNEQNSKHGLLTEVVFAILRVWLGDEAQGRADFAALRLQPHFSDEHAFTFYYFLSAAADARDIAYSRIRTEKPEDLQAALNIILEMPKERSNLSNILDIARAQRKRGDIQAMNKILQIAREQLRKELVAPDKDNDSLEARRMTATSWLISIAQIERDAGLALRAQSTLAQAETMSATRPPKEFAAKLLRAEFYDEAAVLLHQLAGQSGDAVLGSTTNNMYNSAFQAEAALHAKARGVPAAMSWIRKIDNAPVRAVTLATMAVAMTPIPNEERELILTGNKVSGPKVSSHISLPGYSSSYNFSEDHF